MPVSCSIAEPVLVACCWQAGDKIDVKGPMPKLEYKANMKKEIALVAGGECCLASLLTWPMVSCLVSRTQARASLRCCKF